MFQVKMNFKKRVTYKKEYKLAFGSRKSYSSGASGWWGEKQISSNCKATGFTQSNLYVEIVQARERESIEELL